MTGVQNSLTTMWQFSTLVTTPQDLHRHIDNEWGEEGVNKKLGKYNETVN